MYIYKVYILAIYIYIYIYQKQKQARNSFLHELYFGFFQAFEDSIK